MFEFPITKGKALCWKYFTWKLLLPNPSPNLTLLFSTNSHIECSELQSFLASGDSVPRSRAATVVIQEILSMYSDILTFLHTVVQLNTIFCFSLLQDQDSLDRIVQLFSLHDTDAGENLL